MNAYLSTLALAVGMSCSLPAQATPIPETDEVTLKATHWGFPQPSGGAPAGVKSIVNGDFDGDLIEDIAFVDPAENCLTVRFTPQAFPLHT